VKSPFSFEGDDSGLSVEGARASHAEPTHSGPSSRTRKTA